MPAYSGKFQYTGAAGETISQGPCQLNFDKEKCTLTPSGALPILFDLGDVDSFTAGEWDLQLRLYTGTSLALRQFGPAFGRMTQELSAAWRDRTVQCLLLEDLEELGRFEGQCNGQRAEIRIYKTNVAVLPIAAPPTQLRLADVDSISFDPAAYNLTVSSGNRKLVFSKFGKKTDEFAATLQGAFNALRLQSAEVLHETFPFLDPDRLQRLLAVMPEGRTARVDELGGIHPRLVDAFLARAVSPAHKPYFDALRSHVSGGSVMAGFKFIRAGEEQEADEGQESDGADELQLSEQKSEEQTPLFFWFFFPMGRFVAWEAATGSGRATYFFRLNGDVDQNVAALTSGLALVNFRREPVYLSDDSLEQQPRFHRYAIAARKLPDLRFLRSAFAGRAMHSSLEKWSAQMDTALQQRA